MQLINDSFCSCDECNTGDNASSSEVSTSASSSATKSVQEAMSSKRQLQFMKMWGESRKVLFMQPQQEHDQGPTLRNENNQKPHWPTRTFIPSSAWRGTKNLEKDEAHIFSPQPPEAELRTIILSSKQVASDKVCQNGVDTHCDNQQSKGNEQDERNRHSCESKSNISSEVSSKVISDESAGSVQSLCEAAAAAAAASAASSNANRQKVVPKVMREPAEIAALLDNIRLGRRHTYTKDSFAIRLERDLRAELRTELNRQQRLDARLDSLSFGSEKDAQQAVGNVDAFDRVCINSSENAKDSAGAILNSVSRIKRGFTAVGSRDLVKSSNALEQQVISFKEVSNKARLVSQKTLNKTSATAAHGQSRPKFEMNSGSTNSSSDSSESEYRRSLCRWRKPRGSSFNASNRSCNNDEGPECILDDKAGTENSSNSSPAKRQVFHQTQGQGSHAKRSPAHRQDDKIAGGRRTKLNASRFETNPNHAAQLDNVCQSVEQMEPLGAVRILNPRQMLADQHSCLPTDRLTSAPALSEASSNSVAFAPKPAVLKMAEVVKAQSHLKKSAPQPLENLPTQLLQSSDRCPRQQSPGQSSRVKQPSGSQSLNNSSLKRNKANSDQENGEKIQQGARVQRQLRETMCDKAAKQPGEIDRTSDSSINSLRQAEDEAKQIVSQKCSLAENNPGDQRKPRARPDATDNLFNEIDKIRHEMDLGLEHTSASRENSTTSQHGRVTLSPSNEFKATQADPNQQTEAPTQQQSYQADIDSLRRWLYDENKRDRNRNNHVSTFSTRNGIQHMLAAQRIEPHFTSMCSDSNRNGSAPELVGRQCRQVVRIQPQPVLLNSQLRQVNINSRTALLGDQPESLLDQSVDQAPGLSDSGSSVADYAKHAER